MLRFLRRLPAEVGHVRAAYSLRRRAVPVAHVYFNRNARPITRMAAADLIADWATREANHIEASWLARLLLDGPEQAREVAADWRSRAAAIRRIDILTRGDL